MMDVKKKLVELLSPTSLDFEQAAYLADYLVKNGVTVQEWISVNDRLPEENTTVIVATDNGIVFQCLYAYDGWNLWEGNEVNITHWQPMPQPPKGE